MAEKQSNRERLQEITERIEQGVKDVFTSGKYADYLRVMSRFHSYSTNNRLLIFMQNPHASMVCGYQGWQTKFGRHVVKGAKGIQILAPTPYKKKIEEEKRDPDTNLPLRDKDGKILTEKVEIQIPMFRPVTVFDVADTDGKPLPVLVETLTGDVEQFEMFFEAIRRASPVPIVLEPMERSKDGYFSLRHQNIHLRDDMSQVQTICAVFHEITHAKLHNTAVNEERKSRQQEEWEAESVAYSVCAFYGIDTSANSFGYLAEYAQEKSLDELKTGLDLIGKTADEIITAVDQQYAALVQEKEALAISAPEEPETRYSEADQTMPIKYMERYGYLVPDMYPVSRDRALELVDKGVAVFMLHRDNTEDMVFDREEVQAFDGIFGVTQEEWDRVKDTIPPRDVEQRFHENPVDSVAIFQLDGKSEDLFMALDALSAPPDKANYKAVYTEDLPPGRSTADILEDLFFRYNEDRPPDFTGRSLSVSDILALKQGDVVTYHYCDSFGFKELSDFGKASTSVKKEKARPSVLEQIRKPKQQPTKTKTKPKEKTL